MAHLFFEAASPIIKMDYRRDVTAFPHTKSRHDISGFTTGDTEAHRVFLFISSVILCVLCGE
ncbi:hypothetical protein Bacsa_1290 [Phocaeicola salanitronis DSM 18170]|uniref:Uncharacterized protein n=1 Tax=Phocaeicola salanitronis (strain DSM 18170 / JCM 13657 / CCUG 60908 / BL78) TaxID=667015 RepID=F0R755_PHOSB|nr:hypothetical protein Bacsa_1290 [Phocaeicola salanitronis DSM 18170]